MDEPLPLDTRRLRTLRISPEMWLALLREQTGPDPGRLTCDPPIPADRRVVGARFDYWQGLRLVLLVASATLDEVPANMEPPAWDPLLTRHGPVAAWPPSVGGGIQLEESAFRWNWLQQHYPELVYRLELEWDVIQAVLLSAPADPLF